MNLEHKKRWIAAAVGLVALFGIYFLLGHWGLVAISVAISFAAYAEFLKFSGAAASFPRFSWTVGLLLSVWLCLEFPAPMVALCLAVTALLLRGLWQTHLAPAEDLPKNFALSQTRVFGLVYLIGFLSFVPRIHAMAHGPALLLLLLLIIWLGDTAAYYGGKSMGRRKLSLNVSPGKTLEGSFTALVACIVIGLVYGLYFLPYVAAWKLAFLALFTSIVAQAGDLLESLMKRAYQVKDSGTLIPGHGGVFDRFDSLILAAPFFYFLLWIIT